MITPVGKVSITVKEVALKRGIANPFALAAASGVNYATCYSLWQGTQRRVDVDTLAKLCDALKVKPGQLFDYTPE